MPGQLPEGPFIICKGQYYKGACVISYSLILWQCMVGICCCIAWGTAEILFTNTKICLHNTIHINSPF